MIKNLMFMCKKCKEPLTADMGLDDDGQLVVLVEFCDECAAEIHNNS